MLNAGGAPRIADSAAGTPAAYLFTDIEGSTQRWERLPTRMRFAVARHDRILDEVIGRHGGCIQDRAGDGVFATFDAGNPLQCALDIQSALQRENWSAVDGLLVRIGLHAVTLNDADGSQYQVSVNRAARIMSSGWGGQIVVSEAVVKTYPLPEGCELDDLGMCHLRDVGEPLKLFGLIHGGLARTKFPPLRLLSIHSLSLPPQSTPFVGRMRELHEIAEQLESGKTRLLCILSPGGNGKSRLAVEVAGHFAKVHPVHFVNLDAVTSRPQLIFAIAGTMRFPFHGRAPPEDQLMDYLRDKRLLLVLDNFDGLLGERGFLARLLQTCVSLSILATCREPLRVPGGIDYKLAGFALPGPGADELRASPACQLFVQDARTTNPRFELSDDDLGTFREICRVLGGSPLALHLTAQWTHMLPLRSILAKLHQGLEFLNDEGVDVPQRHRSLGSAFEGSWALLAPEQRIGLARLSVFPGDFDAAAAECVSTLGLLDLAALEKKSLLEQSSPRRLSLHPIIREFSRRKLLESGSDHAQALERYSRHYLDLVRNMYSRPAARDQCFAFAQLQQEIANLREAWNIAIRSGATELVRLAIEPLFHFLTLRALYRDAGAFFDVETADRSLNGHLDVALANCLVQQGEFDRAEAVVSRALQDPDIPAIVQGHAYQALGNLAHARGEWETAKGHYETALAIRTRIGDSMGCYFSTTALAALYLLLGDTKSARDRVRQSFRLSNETGNTNGLMVVYLLAGDIALQEKRPVDARASFEDSLRIEETVCNPQHRAIILLRLGCVLASLGDGAGAVSRHQEALDLAAEVGDQRLSSHALLEIGCDRALLNEFDQARTSLLQCMRIGRRLGARPLLLRGVLELASVELKLGRKERARRLVGSLVPAELGALRTAYDTLARQLADSLPPPSAPLALDTELDDLFGEEELSTLRL